MPVTSRDLGLHATPAAAPSTADWAAMAAKAPAEALASAPKSATTWGRARSNGVEWLRRSDGLGVDSFPPFPFFSSIFKNQRLPQGFGSFRKDAPRPLEKQNGEARETYETGSRSPIGSRHWGWVCGHETGKWLASCWFPIKAKSFLKLTPLW